MATTESTPPWRSALARGLVIPACPLALERGGAWSERHQRAVIRYYIDAGAGGLAVGVHSTQFEIRDPKHGLFEPVLRLAAETIDRHASPSFVKIAGICGGTKQAAGEAALACSMGYQAGLLSLTALREEPEDAVLDHCRSIAEVMPVIGFYLQPAVGGRVYTQGFWRRFAEIENVVAIKMAPFNRYYTWDVIRAVIESGREDIALYTGNDDNIIADLLTPFQWQGRTRFIVGGLLGQWGVWTKRAVELLEAIHPLQGAESIPSQWLTKNAELTDINAVVFDAANGFAGCIPGIMEVLRRQGLVPSNRCLNPEERLSPDQDAELDRIFAAYPEWMDNAFVKANLNRWMTE